MAERISKQRSFPTVEQVAELTEAVITLTEQVRCLRHAVDEIESELGWTLRNRVAFVEPIETTARRLKSMPLDPAAADFHARVNEIDPDHLPGFEHAADAEICVNEEVQESPLPSTSPSPLPPARLQPKFW